MVMETIKESITYYSGLQQLSFGVLLIVAVIVVCFSLINLVNTTITNFLSRRQEIGMLQAIGLSKKQLIKMLCYEGLMYSVFATLVTLVFGDWTGLPIRTGSCENDESILLLFISVADRIDIFSNPADCAIHLDFLHNWKSEKNNLLLSKSGRWNSLLEVAGRRVLPRFFAIFQRNF